MIHQFPLRRIASVGTPRYGVVSFELPDDLTQTDVDRLYRWLRTLPIDDPKPLNTPFSDLIESNSRNAGLACGLELIAMEAGIETPDGVAENVNDLTAEIRRRIVTLRGGRVDREIGTAEAAGAAMERVRRILDDRRGFHTDELDDDIRNDLLLALVRAARGDSATEAT